MKAISLFFTLILSLSVLASAAQAQRSQPICKDAQYSVYNNSKHDIKVVDVEYLDQVKGKWVRFPSTKNRLIKAGKNKRWTRGTPGLAYESSTRARIVYKSRKGGKWVLQDMLTSGKATCFFRDTYFTFRVN